MKSTPKTLEQLRAEAYAAFDAHELDMKTNPEYKAVVDKQQARRDARVKTGSNPIKVATPPKIEAWGVKGAHNTPWHETFISAKALINWTINNKAKIEGTREVIEGKAS